MDPIRYSGDHSYCAVNTQVSKGRLLDTFFFPRDLMYLNTTEGGVIYIIYFLYYAVLKISLFLGLTDSTYPPLGSI